MIFPPATSNVAPVTQAAASEARYSAAAATSAGCAIRRYRVIPVTITTRPARSG